MASDSGGRARPILSRPVWRGCPVDAEDETTPGQERARRDLENRSAGSEREIDRERDERQALYVGRQVGRVARVRVRVSTLHPRRWFTARFSVGMMTRINILDLGRPPISLESKSADRIVGQSWTWLMHVVTGSMFMFYLRQATIPGCWTCLAT